MPNSIDMVSVLGPGDEHLGLIERAFDADVHVRGNRITLTGEPAEVALVERLLDEIVTIIRTGQGVTDRDGRAHHRDDARRDHRASGRRAVASTSCSNRGRTIRPKTLNQKRYVDSIDKHTITFGIGPAGTGKTYLAMAKAVQALQAKQVNRIILTRPAVEAGERLGFLPGTLSEKIDPYLRPLYDALHDMLDPETIPKLLAAGTIEVAPLAYMRGRTLNDAFIILDEAQNTSPEQMKMFLTRLGFGSKIVVTGDVTQVDLPGGVQSGLRVVEGILDGVEDVVFNRLTAHDVVRHRLVGRIVAAYDAFDATAARATDPPARLATAGDHPMSIEVLNESGQRARRTPALHAVALRDGQDARPPAGRAVHQGGRRGHHRAAQPAVDGQGRPDRRARLPDGRAASRQGQRGARGGRPRRPRAVPGGRRAPGRRRPVTARDAEIELLTVHGILHLLGYDHAEPEEHEEMFGLQARLLEEWRASGR